MQFLFLKQLPATLKRLCKFMYKTVQRKYLRHSYISFISGQKMGTFINLVRSFINLYANNCRKFDKVAEIVSIKSYYKGYN